MTSTRALEAIDGAAQPPRSNGELVFAEPWQSRAFGLAVALGDRGVLPWEEFRQALIAEVGAHEDDGDAYYLRWLAAFERVLASNGIVAPGEVARRMGELERIDDHRH